MGGDILNKTYPRGRKAIRKKQNEDSSKEMKQVQRDIRSERNVHWKMAVEALLRKEGTAKLGIKVEEAGLVVAYRVGPNDWSTSTVPMRMNRPYHQIADHLQETHGIPAGVRLGKDGSVHLSDGDPKDKLEVAMLPISLVVVGKTREGIWCSEVANAAVPLFAQILGEAVSQAKRTIVQQAKSWASRRIRVLGDYTSQHVDLVRDIDSDE